MKPKSIQINIIAYFPLQEANGPIADGGAIQRNNEFCLITFEVIAAIMLFV